MPIIKLSLTDENYQQLTDLAKAQGISMQDYIRSKLFDQSVFFTPQEAAQKALARYQSGDIFTLPMLYGEDWTLSPGPAGIFGKQFRLYVETQCQTKIEFLDKGGRQAQYRVK